MAPMGPGLEAVDHVGEARGGFGEVGRVDLGDVAQADDLGARARAGDEGLHLLGGQVLGLVQDDVFIEEGAAAHEVQGLDADPVAYQVVGDGAAPITGLAALGAVGEDLQVVHEGAHPGGHLFLLGAGQETDVLAHRDRDARHDDFLVNGLV